MFNKKNANKISEFLSKKFVKKIEKSCEKSIITSLSTLKIIKEKREELDKIKDVKKIELLNFVQFTTISGMDFQVILLRYFHSNISWEFNFNSRVFALNLYEFMNGITELMDHKFNKIILPIIENTKEKEKLTEITSELRAFRKVNEKLIKNIRHNVIGHKDIDAKLQLEIIEAIDHKQLMDLNLQIVNLISKLSDFMTEIFLKI